MDNPWENAWGDDATTPEAHVTPWAAPATVPDVGHVEPPRDAEPDSPVWSAKAVHWTGTAEITPAWGDASSVGGDDDTGDDEPADEPDDRDMPADTVAALSNDAPDSASLPPSPALSASPPSLSPLPPRALSPDAFGTFETAAVDPWTPSQPSFAVPESDSWEAETSWKSPRDDPDSASSKPDEWEAARREREQQDRYVPPEHLASILGQFQELSKDIWPNAQQETEDSSKLQDVDDIDELQPAIQRLVPQDLTLPPTVEFPKTFTSKRLAESLKLTRHSQITRQSPFARYASSKGSTAWEASVKARPDAQADVTPAGWRMVPKEEEVPLSNAPTRPKPGGGLLSFFGRRTSTPPSSDKTPTSPVTRSASGSRSSSPRPSIDAARTSISSVATASAPSISSPLSPTASVASSSSIPAPALSVQPPVQPPPPQLPIRESTPPPSAVSRFLNRFSKSKSGTSPRNSLALSSDDLEFLSDIVPSATDDHDDLIMGNDSYDIKALTGMIGSSPLPTKLPPPLAPPPKAPPMSKVPQRPATDFSSFFDAQTTLPSAPTAPQPPSLSPTSTMPAAVEAFVDLSTPSAQMFSSVAQMSIASRDTPIMKPMHSPALPPMSPFALPSPTLKNFVAGASTAVNGIGNQAQKKIPTAIMSTTLSRPASTTLQSAFTLPPPPSRGQTPSLLENAAPIVHNPVPRPPPPMSLFDDDDFADFTSHEPSPPRQLDNTSFGSYADTSFNSVSSNQNLFASTSSSRSTNAIKEEDFDDFDDFVSPPTTLRTPSPPAPPVKTSTRQAPPPKIELNAQIPVVSPAPSPLWQHPPPTRKARASDHQRTLSLMESTASRKWPAGPPSPLPPMLPQPPGSKKAPEMNIFENTMQDQQMEAMAALPATVSSPALFPPPPRMQVSPPSSMQFSSPPPKTQFAAMTPAPAPASGKAQSGGLSAQDLSFFEGL